jgi:hypothetical protein
MVRGGTPPAITAAAQGGGQGRRSPDDECRAGRAQRAEPARCGVGGWRGSPGTAGGDPPRGAEACRVVSGISGPKRVVFEEGPLSGLIRDALKGVAQEVIAADPTKNALIAHAEDSTDEKDALRLARLSRTGSVHPVYLPEEPYRTLRSVVRYDHAMSREVGATKSRVKALCRRSAIPCR